jgi:uncharacterized tellurite resistance protein B-like protein
MTPGEKNILKALVAVAWADGKVEAPEAGVLDAMCSGFGATDAEKRELVAYAKEPRSLDDAPLDELEVEDREILLANAAVLTHADGVQSEPEKAILASLVSRLEIPDAQAKEIIEAATDGTLALSSRILEDAD